MFILGTVSREKEWGMLGRDCSYSTQEAKDTHAGHFLQGETVDKEDTESGFVKSCSRKHCRLAWDLHPGLQRWNGTLARSIWDWLFAECFSFKNREDIAGIMDRKDMLEEAQEITWLQCIFSKVFSALRKPDQTILL